MGLSVIIVGSKFTKCNTKESSSKLLAKIGSKSIIEHYNKSIKKFFNNYEIFVFNKGNIDGFLELDLPNIEVFEHNNSILENIHNIFAVKRFSKLLVISEDVVINSNTIKCIYEQCNKSVIVFDNKAIIRKKKIHNYQKTA